MNAAPPYAPSWYDRLQDAVDGLPGPSWAYYLAVGLGTAVVLNGVGWVLGNVPVGTLDPYPTSGALYLVIGYAAMHHLDDAAARAWTYFRPATRADDDEAARFAYELTTMPVGPARIATVLGIAAAVVFIVSQYGRPYDLEGEPVLFVLSVVVIVAGFVGTAGALYHSLNQLAGVGRAHTFVNSVDPLHLDPLNAFAAVTARTGVLLTAIGYVGLLTVPTAGANPAVIGTAAVAVAIAIICFVVPLLGIHDAIATEKRRRLAVVNGLIAGGLTELHRLADARDLRNADGLDKQLSTLLVERRLIADSSTWPWESSTVRGFSAGIALPIVLALVNQVLAQVI